MKAELIIEGQLLGTEVTTYCSLLLHRQCQFQRNSIADVKSSPESARQA